jgi:hypothetical protein
MKHTRLQSIIEELKIVPGDKVIIILSNPQYTSQTLYPSAIHKIEGTFQGLDKGGVYYTLKSNEKKIYRPVTRVREIRRDFNHNNL